MPLAGKPIDSLMVTYVLATVTAAAFAAPSSTAPALLDRPTGDWLLSSASYPARLVRDEDEHTLTLTNGLISRVFRVLPSLATVAIANHMTGQNELRGVRPEASVTFDGKSYTVGGLVGQPIHNYLLPQWLNSMKADPAAFRYKGYHQGVTKERFAWKPRRPWMSVDPAWPPPGTSVTFEFEPPESVALGIKLLVHYELYDNLPLICKWITIVNAGASPVTLNSFTSEILALVETGSMVGGKPPEYLKDYRSIQVETDYAFGGVMDSGSDNPSVHFESDPLYETQVHYDRQTPCLLECSPPIGPETVIAPGESLETFRTFELFHDSTERERRGLAARRMYRMICPWVLENPLIMHVRGGDADSVRLAIQQCAEVGFELIIMTFGSGFTIESEDPAYLRQIRELADAAHAPGLALGGYSLLASRRVDDANDVVNPATGKPGGFATFGNSPCIGSSWGRDYFRKMYAFIEQTGIDVLEHDGSYPGDVCASTVHPGHRGLADSQWSQWRTITDFYKWCRSRGVYLNVPDWYYLSGSSKCGMGYRETNWSLPREQQEIIERQNIYDGSWGKTPSMGWMFVPLTEYQGGGAAATIEPLAEHLDHYQVRLMNLLGAGVQACYRGPRLYDTDQTRAVVKKWVAWYKQYRTILESDIVHGRRADGCDVDWLLHVNPGLPTRGMLVVYNPLPQRVTRSIEVDLYYTGLTDIAAVGERGGEPVYYHLSRDYHMTLPVTIEARSMNWFTIQK